MSRLGPLRTPHFSNAHKECRGALLRWLTRNDSRKAVLTCFTVVSFISRDTIACVLVDLVLTGSSIVAWVAVTFIGICNI